MINQQETNLLADLARLLKKYGPEVFESLASSIASPERAQRLSMLLATIATNENASRFRGSRRTNHRSMLQSLARLEETDPEKCQILIRFRDDLLAQKILPTLAEVRDFSLRCGLPVIAVNSRQKAIPKLVTALAALPVETIRSHLASLREAEPPKSDLEGWAEVILNRQRRMRQAAR